MNKAGFFPKLAFQSIRKNGKLYIPYFLTCIGASAMFYIMIFLMQSSAFEGKRGANTVPFVLLLGAIVIAIFSAILLFYTNSFLIKRRRRELGLYNILGMEKRHIGRIMLWETIYTALIGVVGGVLVGILFSKLVLLLLCALLKFDVFYGFYVSWMGILLTAVVYCAIFFLNLLTNLVRVGKAKPVDLLHSAATGEREPKTKWLLTLIGLLTLGGGYYIAITTESPLKALALFFIAVILVIIGTYCLFTAGSIAILKLLRRNKRYYYKAKHFTSVSGMIYRMKRNAAGLASICILSTMVLVTVSSTLCLYLGSQDSLDSRFPNDMSFEIRNPGEGVVEKAVSVIQDEVKKQGVSISDITLFKSLDVSMRYDENENLSRDGSLEYNLDDSAVTITYFITDEEYSNLTGNSVSLSPGEALVQTKSNTHPVGSSISVMGKVFSVETVDDFPMTGDVAAYVAQMTCFVVCEPDLWELNELTLQHSTNQYDSAAVSIRFDMEGSSDEQVAFFDTVVSALCEQVYGEYTAPDGSTQTYEYYSLGGECRAYDADEFYSMYGGFFFLGIFLGFLFLMATVLIIYYKQISEGYEDADRFRIMRQVGMSEKEVRTSIKSQILTVFFLPLLMAAVHIAAAFKMITRLLVIFSLSNVPLFAMCCVGTLLVFAIIYAIIYTLTAKAYYQIVRA